MHHKDLTSTNMLERLNDELRPRTLVVRIFPNANSCLRSVRALCAEVHETWLSETWLRTTAIFISELLREQRKEQLRRAA
jgi:transposase-like protein